MDTVDKSTDVRRDGIQFSNGSASGVRTSSVMAQNAESIVDKNDQTDSSPAHKRQKMEFEKLDLNVKPKSLLSAPSTSKSASDLQIKADTLETKVQNMSSQISKIKTNSHVILKEDDPIVTKAYSLAQFIVKSVTETTKVKPVCKVEEALLRNVNLLLTKHEITFKSIMRRLNINEENDYLTFVNVADELFENQKRSVTWSRILVLFAFGAQLALHCHQNNMKEVAKKVSGFIGQYVSEVAGLFIKEQGGWEKLLTEFPPDTDMSDTIWKMLAWTALGLGLATATSMFFSSSH